MLQNYVVSFTTYSHSEAFTKYFSKPEYGEYLAWQQFMIWPYRYFDSTLCRAHLSYTLAIKAGGFTQEDGGRLHNQIKHEDAENNECYEWKLPCWILKSDLVARC